MEIKVYKYSCIIGLIVSLLGGIIFQSVFIGVSILIGTLTGLIGFRMILRMVNTMPADEEAGKKIGQAGYMRRYLFYGLVLGVCAYFGLSVLGILIGLMCHKASLLLYAYLERKDLHE